MVEWFNSIWHIAPSWPLLILVLITAATVGGFVFLGVRVSGDRRRRRDARKIREDGIKYAAEALDQAERFEWDYKSGRYQHAKAIPRTLGSNLMSLKEAARRDNGIGEFSPPGRYLAPPESSWD